MELEGKSLILFEWRAHYEVLLVVTLHLLLKLWLVDLILALAWLEVSAAVGSTWRHSCNGSSGCTVVVWSSNTCWRCLAYKVGWATLFEDRVLPSFSDWRFWNLILSLHLRFKLFELSQLLQVQALEVSRIRWCSSFNLFSIKIIIRFGLRYKSPAILALLIKILIQIVLAFSLILVIYHLCCDLIFSYGNIGRLSRLSAPLFNSLHKLRSRIVPASSWLFICDLSDEEELVLLLQLIDLKCHPLHHIILSIFFLKCADYEIWYLIDVDLVIESSLHNHRGITASWRRCHHIWLLCRSLLDLVEKDALALLDSTERWKWFVYEEELVEGDIWPVDVIDDLENLFICDFVYICLQPAHQSCDDLVFARDIYLSVT